MTASAFFPPEVIKGAIASRVKWDVPASVCLAQWAIESAWGAAVPPGSNNPFGIKAVPDQDCVTCTTHEDVGGRLVAVQAKFRKFGSVAEAFDAHGKLLATGTPYAAARKVRHDPDAFADALTGVYATDHLYGAKLQSMMKAHGLYAYDKTGIGSDGPVAAPASPPVITPTAAPVASVGPLPINTHIDNLPATAKPRTWLQRLKDFFAKTDG